MKESGIFESLLGKPTIDLYTQIIIYIYASNGDIFVRSQ